MDPALAKTLTFLFFIVLGVLLKTKLTTKDQVNGLQKLILAVALPATIFVALMGVKIDLALIILPVMALLFNFALYWVCPLILRLFDIPKQSSAGRTLRMLIPSLAPGLSCFPFLLEYLGEEPLANAALADVGNKLFVLIFLYMVAINLFQKRNKDEVAPKGQKVKSLLISLLKEPINMVMSLAILLLSLGLNMESLPDFLSDAFGRLATLMTPLVLIFIGLAVKLEKGKVGKVVSVLLVRAGVSVLLSVLLITAFGLDEKGLLLLTVVFPLSSCSFWPFAHMSVFDAREKNRGISTQNRSFDTDFAVLVLACSLPFSTALILGILSNQAFFADLSVLWILGFSLTALGILPHLLRKVYNNTLSSSRTSSGLLKKATD
ncbi:MAG: hypothetical protein Roseis2KO_10270 [Roseivirga sp.]